MPELFSHPFASFCWKALIALHERRVDFVYRQVGADQPENQAALEAVWPVAQFPVLVDGTRVLLESSVIVEHLDRHHGGSAPPMVPLDTTQALDVRMMDRVFDDYVAVPMQRIVADFIRPPESRDPLTVTSAKATLGTIYDWLDQRRAGHTWAAGDDFSLADCAAAPALFYADWVQPIGHRTVLAADRQRLLARPSVARVVDDARPYRHFFPPGAPDRD